MDGITGPLDAGVLVDTEFKSLRDDHADESAFKVGDIVDYHGATGKVISTDGEGYPSMTDYPITVLLDTGYKCQFTTDGRNLKVHKTPSIKVIGFEKPKTPKYLWAYIFPTTGKWVLTDVLYSEAEVGFIADCHPTKIPASKELV